MTFNHVTIRNKINKQPGCSSTIGLPDRHFKIIRQPCSVQKNCLATLTCQQGFQRIHRSLSSSSLSPRRHRWRKQPTGRLCGTASADRSTTVTNRQVGFLPEVVELFKQGWEFALSLFCSFALCSFALLLFALLLFALLLFRSFALHSFGSSLFGSSLFGSLLFCSSLFRSFTLCSLALCFLALPSFALASFTLCAFTLLSFSLRSLALHSFPLCSLFICSWHFPSCHSFKKSDERESLLLLCTKRAMGANRSRHSF